MNDDYRKTLNESNDTRMSFEEALEAVSNLIKMTKVPTIEIKEYTEFELAGFHLTDELRESLIKCGITAQILKSITSEKELLDKIAEKWNELSDISDNESKPLKKKTQTWKKKKFYE